jgi:hypothetical protein
VGGAGLSSWAELAGGTTVTFRALFGDIGDESRLPEREARAAETVARVVSGLAELGAVEPVADLTALGLTLGLELADDLPRQGRFGTGVLVAPLGSAIGLDLDVVFVVGLAEELVPAGCTVTRWCGPVVASAGISCTQMVNGAGRTVAAGCSGRSLSTAACKTAWLVSK